MYLSRLKLNPSLRNTKEILINPYTLHQAVYRAFPDKLDDGPGRVLYRVDENKRINFVRLIVQSEKEPDWPKADFITNCLLEPAEHKVFAPRFEVGQTLRFRVRANPSVKKQAEGKKNGYRLGILREDDQFRWLGLKAESGGFTLVSCETVPEGVIQDERGKKDKDKLRHFAVRFEGILRITDDELFRTAIVNGIGAAKGFGFGLLSVAPLRG
jgi:CRISPR system Cascade subunit CasE